MKHKLYNRLLSLALAVGLVIGMLPSAAAVDTVGGTQARNTPSVWSVSFTKDFGGGNKTTTLNFKMYDTEGNPLTVASTDNLSLLYNGEETEKEYEIQKVLMQQGLNEIVTADGEKWIYQNTLLIDGDKIRTIDAFGEYYSKGALFWKEYLVKLYDAVFEADGFYSRDGSADIRMIYRKASDTESGDVHTEMDLERHKTVTKNLDGTYNLELSVSGAVGNITDPVKLDVMFIVDQSGSMKDELSNGTNRAEAVVNAVRSMTNQLESNQNIDPHYSVVTFSSGINGTQYYKDAIQKLYWTDNAEDAVSAVKISPNGGTNYEAGLLMGRAMLMGSRPNAQKVVIFLSDGMPTYHYENGNTEGGGNSTTSADKNNAYAEASRITNVNSFYSIRVGDERGADAILQEICDRVHASSEGSAAENFKVYSAEKVDELNSVFDQIQGNITQVLCDHVSVKDTLSENVQPVEGASPKVIVTDENGKTVPTPNGITASLTGKELKLSFPEDYKLEKGYEYKVSLTIEPTDRAYQKYSENGLKYPDPADKDTGTHKEQYGFYSNDEATVTYTYNGQTQVNEYPKPVIQLNPGTLIITKQITGDLTEEQIAALENSIKFEVELNGVKTSYPLSSFTSQGDNSYTMSIAGLSPNTQYIVTESGADLPGYILTQTPDDGKITGTVAKGGTVTAAFTNNYKVATRDISVTKVWEGSETNPESVTVWLYADGKKTDKFVTLNDTNKWTDSFTGLDIYNTEGKEIAYTVQEDTVNGYTGVVTGDMTKGFTITNTRDVGSLTIEKTVEGLDETALDELKNELKFTVTEPDGTTQEISFSQFSTGNGVYTYTLERVPTGSYTVTETGYDTLEKYSWVKEDSTATANADVTKGDTATAALTNVYIGKDGKLNINKVVTKFANDGKPVFDFKLTAEDGTVYYYHVDMTGMAIDTEKPATPEGGVTLPVGDYTITELRNQNYTLNSVDGATANNDGIYTVTIKPQGTTTVTFTNDPKNTNIPTDGSATKNTVASVSEGVITWKQEPDEYGKDPNHNNINPNDEPAE